MDDPTSVSEEKGTNFYCGSKWPQYFSAFTINLAAVSIGTVISWPATAVPDIESGTTNFAPLSSDQVSWVTSSAMLGGLLACPVTGYVIQKCGLRRSILLFAFPMLLGWLVILFSNSFWMLIVGRILTGIGMSGTAMAGPAFVAETSEASIRGKLGFALDIMCAVGELYIFVIGSFVSWQWQTVACVIIPMLFYACVVFIPESPRYLVSQNKIDEAKTSLAWFRGASSKELVNEEFKIMQEDFASVDLNEFKLRDYFTPIVVKPTLICVTLMFFYNMTGSAPIFSYTVQIFEDAKVGTPFLATILTGVTQVVVAMISALFVDRVGRRVLLILSAIGMAFSLGLFAVYLNLDTELGNGWQWCPIALIILYTVTFSIGFGPIPWVIMGEVIPAGARGYTSAVIVSSYRLSAFISTYTFNHLAVWFGQYICFVLFGISAVLASLFVYFFIPETKQKTLQEIQMYFQKNGNKQTVE